MGTILRDSRLDETCLCEWVDIIENFSVDSLVETTLPDRHIQAIFRAKHTMASWISHAVDSIESHNVSASSTD